MELHRVHRYIDLFLSNSTCQMYSSDDLHFIPLILLGFDDALRSLDKLTPIKFDLPTDLAVRQLSSITEAF